MDPVGSAELAAAVERTHGVEARWLESTHVHEVFGDVLVWDGEVEVFEVAGHPQATRAFAWSFEVVGRPQRKIVTVLAVPPIETPAQAVRATVEGAATTLPVLSPIR